MNLANPYCKPFAPTVETPCLAGWRRGYAPDCKSALEKRVTHCCHSDNSADRCFCKHRGQTENEPKTLQTAGWWFLPAVAIGLAVWMLIFHWAGVL